MRGPAIAARLGCHSETVRRRLRRFNAEGIDGLGDQPVRSTQHSLTPRSCRTHLSRDHRPQAATSPMRPVSKKLVG
ncbi:helix-turn-helix domain-containing protein [Streptosporangium sp. NBC_01756]|uniref:helix-turn-helix domain-containing protein n=1 Tax=Streptosporangium sp. NBC_01756 TaxID=2975950 RepID=UPI002DD8BBFF|nr:helix-turn-helix domain-containing protein [Streptosporangium sp. NBC_01756]